MAYYFSLEESTSLAGQRRKKRNMKCNDTNSKQYAALLLFSSGFTLVFLFLSLAIFGWLAVRYRNIRRFEFQILIFIIIYIVGEIIESYKASFLVSALPYIGSQIHVVAAVFFAIVLWLRLNAAINNGRKIEPVQEDNNI